MTGLSYVSGISDEPLLGMTIGQALDARRRAMARPPRADLAEPRRRVELGAQLRELARNLAAALRALGSDSAASGLVVGRSTGRNGR